MNNQSATVQIERDGHSSIFSVSDDDTTVFVDLSGVFNVPTRNKLDAMIYAQNQGSNKVYEPNHDGAYHLTAEDIIGGKDHLAEILKNPNVLLHPDDENWIQAYIDDKRLVTISKDVAIGHYYGYLIAIDNKRQAQVPRSAKKPLRRLDPSRAAFRRDGEISTRPCGGNCTCGGFKS